MGLRQLVSMREKLHRGFLACFLEIGWPYIVEASLMLAFIEYRFICYCFLISLLTSFPQACFSPRSQEKVGQKIIPCHHHSLNQIQSSFGGRRIEYRSAMQ